MFDLSSEERGDAAGAGRCCCISFKDRNVTPDGILSKDENGGATTATCSMSQKKSKLVNNQKSLAGFPS